MSLFLFDNYKKYTKPLLHKFKYPHVHTIHLILTHKSVAKQQQISITDNKYNFLECMEAKILRTEENVPFHQGHTSILL